MPTAAQVGRRTGMGGEMPRPQCDFRFYRPLHSSFGRGLALVSLWRSIGSISYSRRLQFNECTLVVGREGRDDLNRTDIHFIFEKQEIALSTLRQYSWIHTLNHSLKKYRKHPIFGLSVTKALVSSFG